LSPPFRPPSSSSAWSANGFLHISDLHPKYFPGDAKEETEQVGLKTPRRDRPPIQKCLRRGQEILVQVLKEGIGTKGPTLTSYLSIPGRYLVMMPDMERLGVSRKLEDDEARRKLRDMLSKIKLPKGFGFIGRTAAADCTLTDIKRDAAYLIRLWKNIDRRMKEVRIGELFAESDLVIRTIRDIYSSDIERIIVDNETAARRARDFLAISNPRSGSNVLVYRDQVPLFNRYDVERQIENINAKTVPLESGGSLVIESTEALVAIDVNSGKNRDSRDAETTAYKINLEATDEICRQLRLRDLGGVIVNDLIDMRSLSHRREIEQRFRENLKKDRARTRTLPISQFGILEMTRQRMRPSLKKSIYTDCPSCAGAGLVKSPESVVLDVMRRLALAMNRQQVARLELTVSPDVAFQLLNKKRSHLVAVETAHGKPVMVRVNGGAGIDYVALAGFDARGGAVEAEVVEKLGDPTLEPVEALPGLEEEILDDEEVLEGASEGVGEDAPADDRAEDTARDDARDGREDDARPSREGRDDRRRQAPVDREESPEISGDAGADDRQGTDDEGADSEQPLAARTGGSDGRSTSGAPVAPNGDQGQEGEGGGRRRRRRRRGRRGRGKGTGENPAQGQPQAHGGRQGTPNTRTDEPPAEMNDAGDSGSTDESDDREDTSSRGEFADVDRDDDAGADRQTGGQPANDEAGAPDTQGEPGTGANGETDPNAPAGGKRRRRRRGGRGRRGRGKRDGAVPPTNQGGQSGGQTGAQPTGGPPTSPDVSRGYKNIPKKGEPNGNIAPPPPPLPLEPPGAPRIHDYHEEFDYQDGDSEE